MVCRMWSAASGLAALFLAQSCAVVGNPSRLGAHLHGAMLLAGDPRLSAEMRGAVQRGGEVTLAGRLLANDAPFPSVTLAADLGVGATLFAVALAHGVGFGLFGADAHTQCGLLAPRAHIHTHALAGQLLLHHLARFGGHIFELLLHLRHTLRHCVVAPRHLYVVFELPQARLQRLSLCAAHEPDNRAQRHCPYRPPVQEGGIKVQVHKNPFQKKVNHQKSSVRSSA